eukprot:TRINITY_DN329_c0_g1_i1.p1 TRINITY_DN329_c0_g1~~TRINITY_DN329_c0_g1_i1.p1  ORF type:complete len:138 (-),score=35.88 TRINITY_DN329_c0_g1_i1:177-590(-)
MEKFASMTVSFYKNSDFIFFVFDLSQENGLESMSNWLGEVDEFIRSKPPKKFLLGNKLDLSAERKVSEKDARDFATANGLEYMEVSAKSGENVDLFFITTLRNFLGIQGDSEGNGSPKVKQREKRASNFLKRLIKIG